MQTDKAEEEYQRKMRDSSGRSNRVIVREGVESEDEEAGVRAGGLEFRREKRKGTRTDRKR